MPSDSAFLKTLLCSRDGKVAPLAGAKGKCSSVPIDTAPLSLSGLSLIEPVCQPNALLPSYIPYPFLILCGVRVSLNCSGWPGIRCAAREGLDPEPVI